MAGRAGRFLAIAAFVAVGAACGSDAAPEPVAATRPDRTTTTTSTRAPVSSTTTTVPAPTTTSATRPPAPDRHGPFTVTRVVDGDTVKLSTGATLRLIGIDTPETVDPRKPVQCFGREASLYAHKLLDGASVMLEYDPTQGRLDKYGRTLAYVWLPDGRMYNETIVAEGFAHEYTYAIPYRYQDRFVAAERAARDASRGLWSPSTCAGDTTQPAAGPITPPRGGVTRPGCDPSYPDVCIPPSPPDLDCADVAARGFRVAGADPHRFDADHDGFGCE